MTRCAALAASGVLLLLAAGCGGEDEDESPVAPAATTSTQAEPPSASTTEAEAERPKPAKRPRRERTAASLAACIREAPGVSDVLVKARDSEDAAFFADLVGGRVDVLGVTVEGESSEVTVALFASTADATEAAPNAGGGTNLTAEVHGSAVVVAPAGARPTAIHRCLRDTGYAG